ncbi:MAG: TonB-dependent receptor [Bacteroidetes bacterium]|nr:TonB-dependent receptor [Bacteroidota bacterium]
MKEVFIRHVFLFLLGFVPMLAEAVIPDTVYLDAVEVKGRHLKKASFQTHSLDSLSIAAYSASDLGSLLAAGSNVFIKNYGPGGLSTASFRGTSANQTLVLWNDIPLNSPNLGQVDFSMIPVQFVDQLQLAWGSAASAMRSGGLGGVVSLDNKPDFNRKLILDVVQTAGSYRHFGSYGTLGYSGRKVIVKTRAFRKSALNDFEFLNTALLPQAMMKQTSADYTDYGFLQELHIYTGKNSQLSAYSWNQWNNRNLPPIMTNIEKGGQPTEFQYDRFHRHMVAFKQFWSGGKLEAKAAYFTENQHYYLKTINNPEDNETVTLIDSRNTTHAFHTVLQANHQLNWWLELTAGYTMDQEAVNTTNFVKLQKRQRNLMKLGATFRPLQDFKGSVYFSREYVDGKASGLSPALELAYVPFDKLPLTIGIGLNRNLRYPSLNDLYWFPGGNAKLKPEIGHTAELFVNLNPQNSHSKHKVNASMFFSDVSDWIQWKPTSYRYWVPVNIARVFARGVELNWQWEGDFNLFHLQASANFAYTRTTDESPVAKIENTAGKQLMYIPRHHANLMAQLDIRQYYVKTAAEFVGKRNTSLNGEEIFINSLKPYVLFNLALGKSWKLSQGKLTAEFQVLNLLNSHYQAVMWRPMPGRNFQLLLRYAL